MSAWPSVASAHHGVMSVATRVSATASLPLAMVWISADANKYRKLVWAVVFLTFDLIVFGAFTRTSGATPLVMLLAYVEGANKYNQYDLNYNVNSDAAIDPRD